MPTANSLNMDTTGVQTFNATNGGLDGSTVTQYFVVCGDLNNKLQLVASLGTAGQVLTSNGAGALPTWQTAPGGGSAVETLTFIGSTSASGSTVVFTNLSADYKGYRFFYVSLVPSVSAALRLRFSTDGGSSYDSSAHYSRSAETLLATFIPLSSGNAATHSGVFSIYYNNITDANVQFDNGTVREQYFYTEKASVDALQFFLSTGTFSSGTIFQYGIT